GLELVDEILADSYSSSEVMRCVCIGLLCSQGYCPKNYYKQRSNFVSSQLEIICGKKNISFYSSDQHVGFLAYVSSHSKS
ncbi:unnamed protein product, partial [Prunus brigantina]